MRGTEVSLFHTRFSAALYLVLAGLALFSPLAGCASVKSASVGRSSSRSTAVPRELVLLCRPNVLHMQDGSRQSGIVVQAFLMGAGSQGPIAVPAGQFRFAASPPSTHRPSDSEPVGSWTFPSSELPRHLIEHSLGPCYAFWLPCPSIQDSRGQLLVQATFQCEGCQLQSSPVKVVMPGS